MKQQTRRLIIILGGAMLSAAGLTLAACSTDNGSTPLPTAGSDSGRDTGGNTGKDTGSPTENDGDTPGQDGGGGADCGDAPSLHKTTSGFFCAFYKDGGMADAGGNSNCANNETCCNPGKNGATFPPSFCASTPASGKGDNGQDECNAQATAKSGVAWVAAGSSTWECASSENCGAGNTCCIVTSAAEKADGGHVNIGKASGSTAPPAACNALQAYKYGGTICKASCTGLDEIELCSETANNCAGGKKCTPFVVQPGFRDFGYCK